MNYPCVKPNSSNRLVLDKDFTIENVSIPKGFTTNGADIPRLFWVIVPPFKPKYLPAVILHDYLIEISKEEKDIDFANNTFSNALLKIENSFVTRNMVRLVFLYWKIVRRKK